MNYINMELWAEKRVELDRKIGTLKHELYEIQKMVDEIDEVILADVKGEVYKKDE